MLDYRLLDWKLFAAALALSAIGIVLIYSAGHNSTNVYVQGFWLRQLQWLAVALFAYGVVIHLPPRLFDAGAYFFFAGVLALLVAVLLFGDDRLGARRWFDFGPISLTPSDIAKLALLLVLARFFAYTRLPVTSTRRLAISAFIVLVPMALIIKQPDLGSSLVLAVILLGLWFWSGLSPAYLFLVLSPFLSLAAAFHWLSWVIYLVVLLAFVLWRRPSFLFGFTVVVANLAFGTITPLVWNRLQPYQQQRILSFLDPGQDPRGAGYQIIQSKIAVGSGGITGKGYLDGSQSRLDFLPERHTDFIFSILGEEFGLIGSLIVLLLFAFILYRGIMIATKCRSRFLSYATFGVVSVLLFQLLVNVGMTLGMMPVTGLPLPFVSYGGTSLVLVWTLIGLMQLAHYHWQEY